MSKICLVDGCEKETRTKGYCKTHYEYNRKHGHPVPIRKTLLERFEDKVLLIPESTCHWWIGVQNGGYGQIKIGNATKKAHRVSFELYKGTIPEGLQVCHKCDNPSCVNPDHLWLGTAKDNAMDMAKKGRQVGPFGEKQHLSKLTESDVIEIRKLKLSYTYIEIGEMYGVYYSTIEKIVNGRTWKHVK